MGMFDDALGKLAGNPQLEALAAKVGLTPEQVATGLKALGAAQGQPGETAEQASATSGLPVDKLRQLLSAVGGEGALGNLGAMLGNVGGGMFGKS